MMYNDSIFRFSLALAKDEMRKYGLLDNGWQIKLDRSTTRAGMCIHNKKIITFSKFLFSNTTITKDQVIDIILHEIAHALVGYEHGHDKVWRTKALELGCSGEVFHCLTLCEPVARLSCPCGAFKRDVWRVGRAWKEGKYTCQDCEEIIEVEWQAKHTRARIGAKRRNV